MISENLAGVGLAVLGHATTPMGLVHLAWWAVEPSNLRMPDLDGAADLLLSFESSFFAGGDFLPIISAHHGSGGYGLKSVRTANLHEPDASLPYRWCADDMRRHSFGQLPPLG